MEPRLYPVSRTVMRGISVALVATLAFGTGLMVGNTTSAAAVITRIPLLGDGLDATPDSSADLTNFWKAWNTLRTSYVNTNASSTVPSNKDLMYGAIQGLANAYGDPYTIFFPPKEAAEFAESISGTFGGVGMEIAVKNNVLTIVAPLKGMPAEKAGVKAGDEIVAIDQKPTDGVSVEEAVSQIRGTVGTTVALSIVRDGELMEIKIVRANIQVPELEDSFDVKNRLYRIALYEFNANAARDFNQAFSRFKASRAKRLILDLRGNPGGYLDAAVSVASHFLPKGAPVVTEDYGEKRAAKVHASLGINDLPAGTKVVVLIDGGSASASEIVAGALKDSGVATVIGTRSFGKGSVQQLISLDQGSLKVTVARWITPAGNSIAGNGVTPHITIPYTKQDADKDGDPQMERAVQFVTTGK